AFRRFLGNLPCIIELVGRRGPPTAVSIVSPAGPFQNLTGSAGGRREGRDVAHSITSSARNGATLDPPKVAQALQESRDPWARRRKAGRAQEPDRRQLRRLLRACNKRPHRCGAAECDQQFPPSDRDCHTPLPCEVRKGNDTTPRARSLHVQQGRMLVASTSVGGFGFRSGETQNE